MQVIETLPERFKRIGGTFVLFHGKPLAAAGVGGGDDFFPIEVAVANFAHGDLVLRRHAIILEMDDGQPTGQPLAPRDGITAAELHPVRIRLALQIPRIGLGVDDFQDRPAAHALEFGVVIVVAENLARLVEDFAGGVQAAAEFLDRGERGEADAAGVGIRGDPAPEFLEAGDDGLRLVEDQVTGLVGRTESQAIGLAELDEIGFGDGAHAADLNGLIADGPDFFQAGGDVGRSFEVVADTVELGGKLAGFHRLNPFAKSAASAVPGRTSFLVNREFLTSCLRVRW